MKLAIGEHIIGEWEYADKKTKKGLSTKKTHALLTLTNKRIVHDCVDKHSIYREEIQLKEITSINYFHSKKSNFWVWCKIIFGAITIPVIIGIFILKNAISQLNAGEFSLNITTGGVENLALSIGASKGADARHFGLFSFLKAIILLIPNIILGIFGIHIGGSKEKVKSMHVHHDVIDEIIDVLGAAVMDSKVKNVTIEEFDK